MTIRDFERRLQECNPKLHIKTYGNSFAAVFMGSKHICRIAPGEITPYNTFRMEHGINTQYMTDWNPKGKYQFKLLLKRGRAEAARVLYTQRVITFADISKLSI